MFQTDSDEDVIFVSEKTAPKSREVTIDQVKLLALQRDIDQESLPREQAEPVKSQRSSAVKMKTEEEKSEKNLNKKEKKRKKEQASLPNSKNYTDDGGVVEVKKEKKEKKKEQTVVLDEEMTLDVIISKESKKKKKKGKVSDSLNVNDDENEKVSKKKTNLLASHEDQDEVATILAEEGTKQRKEKKGKKNSVQVKLENVKVEKEEGDVDQAGNDNVQKKAKKRKNNISVVNKEKTEEQVKEKTKKKIQTVAKTQMGVGKKNDKVAENGKKLKIPEDTIDKGDEVKVKKKKKNKIKDESEVETSEVKGNGKISKKISKISAKKNENRLAKTDIVIDDEKIESRKKVKKEKKRKASGEVSETEDPPPKKKKGKRAKREEDEALSNKVKEAEEDEQSRESLTNTKSKRKKSFPPVEQVDNIVTDVAKRKKKIKLEVVEEPQEPPQLDVVFLSEKSGNTDEVTINQERRQALQMEIDKASQPEKPAKPSVPQGLGQWSTAQFDTSAQQQKFLRLMGGLKKGFQAAAASGGGANMAMGKQAQQQLQQGLLGEFERAHSRRMDFSSRGTGLGFAPPSNKKFSIDINASRSVRFDD